MHIHIPSAPGPHSSHGCRAEPNQAAGRGKTLAGRGALLLPARAPSRSRLLGFLQNWLHAHPSQKRRPCPKPHDSTLKIPGSVYKAASVGISRVAGGIGELGAVDSRPRSNTEPERGRVLGPRHHTPTPMSLSTAARRDPVNCRLASPSWWPEARTRFFPEGRATEGRGGRGRGLRWRLGSWPGAQTPVWPKPQLPGLEQTLLTCPPS